MIVGTTYLLAGVPVKVLARWRAAAPQAVTTGMTSVTPRNVLLELPDGSRTVRPFRGLRKLPQFPSFSPEGFREEVPASEPVRLS